jgi:hypothetical protein
MLVITLQAVTPGTDSFQINGTIFGSASVNGGVAIYNGTNESWSAGSYTITTIYTGMAITTARQVRRQLWDMR